MKKSGFTDNQIIEAIKRVEHDLAHVQRAATQRMWSYYHERPSMALGGFTPKQWVGHGRVAFLLPAIVE